MFVCGCRSVFVPGKMPSIAETLTTCLSRPAREHQRLQPRAEDEGGHRSRAGPRSSQGSGPRQASARVHARRSTCWRSASSAPSGRGPPPRASSKPNRTWERRAGGAAQPSPAAAPGTRPPEARRRRRRPAPKPLERRRSRGASGRPAAARPEAPRAALSKSSRCSKKPAVDAPSDRRCSRAGRAAELVAHLAAEDLDARRVPQVEAVDLQAPAPLGEVGSLRSGGRVVREARVATTVAPARSSLRPPVTDLDRAR